MFHLDHEKDDRLADGVDSPGTLNAMPHASPLLPNLLLEQGLPKRMRLPRLLEQGPPKRMMLPRLPGSCRRS
jgi:hypothetical protein